MVLALIASGCYGAADFVGGVAAKRVGTRQIILVSQAAGLAVTLFLAWWFGGAMTGPREWAWSVVAGLFIFLALATLYRALAMGPMGVVAPITALIAIVVPIVFAVIANGERPGIARISGFIIGAAAIAIISGATGRAGSRSRLSENALAITLAVTAGLAIAGFYIALSKQVPSAGLWPLAFARFVTFAVALLFVLRQRDGDAEPINKRDTLLIAFSGGLDATATGCYQLALHSGGALSVVATLSSLYPAVTVLLAAAVLRERVFPSQWFGLLLVVSAIVLITS